MDRFAHIMKVLRGFTRDYPFRAELSYNLEHLDYAVIISLHGKCCTFLVAPSARVKHIRKLTRKCCRLLIYNHKKQ